MTGSQRIGDASDRGLQQALQHERALRRLAASLLRDPASAADAVQHALVQEALQRRRPGAPLLPFLRATLRRYASNLRMLAQRRARREAAAARPEALPSAAEIAAREQLRRRVADAVQALDEPYRTTVWLRWFEDLAAHEVAARMAVPLATVRTRLLRAHAQLRSRLDRDYGDRAAWAAVALPFAEAMPVAAALAFGVSLPKVLASAAVVLALACGYALWPAAGPLPAPRTGAAQGVAAAVAGSAAAPDAAARDRVPTAGAASTAAVAATPRQLRVVHADGSPARALPVLLWHAADLPRWATRVADGPATMGPGIANAWEEPAPPRNALATGADGCVTLPENGGEVAAVSVQFADQQWFSAALPASDGPLVLPAMAEIEIGVRGAPPDTAWEALVIPAFFMHDGDTNAAGAMRENVLTASGPGVVRLRQQQFRLGTAERVHAPMLLGHRVMINAWGHRCELRCIGQHDGADIAAPGVLEYEFVRRCPTLEVRVDEPSGLPARRSGTVYSGEPKGATTFSVPMAGGVARFDEGLAVGVPMLLRAILDDGEQFRREVTFAPTDGVQSIAFVRGTGERPWQVRLPALEAVHAVYRELADGHLDLVSRPETAPMIEEPVFLAAAGQLTFIDGDRPAQRLWIVAPDGRVAVVMRGTDANPITADWLDGAPLDDIDTGALLRQYGDPPNAMVGIRLQLVSAAGDTRDVWPARYLRFPEQEYPSPPPVWRGFSVPRGLAARFLIALGGEEHELPLPRR